MPVFLTALASPSTDIVEGTCIPWGVYSSYAAEKAMTATGFLFTYLLPLMTMLFCYSRIIYTLRLKVSCLPICRICMLRFYRATACNAMHGIAKDFLFGCLSVKRVDCDKKLPTFLYHMKAAVARSLCDS